MELKRSNKGIKKNSVRDKTCTSKQTEIKINPN